MNIYRDKLGLWSVVQLILCHSVDVKVVSIWTSTIKYHTKLITKIKELIKQNIPG